MLPPSDRRRLDSWKEIASHLGRTVRTVQRWERDEGLPVHRHAHHKLSSVYAYSDELDRWWEQTRSSAELKSLPERDPVGSVDPAPAAVDVRVPADSASPAARQPRYNVVLMVATAVLSLAALAPVAIWRGDAGASAATVASLPGASPAGADALYRRGRAHWQQRTPRGFEQARQAFEAAVAADPDHAQAHAGLADTYTLLESFGLMGRDEALDRARIEAEHAVRLAPDLGEARASLALVLWERRDIAPAMAEMERALDLDPHYATAHHWYGLFLQQYLRRDEAITELRRAVALDPSQPVFWTDLASILKGANRFGEAEALLQQASQTHQGFPEIYTQLADLALARGDSQQAVALLRRAVALGDNRARILSRLGCLEGTTGNPAGVTEALHLLRDMEATGHHVPDDALAALLAWTGDLEGAFRHIRRALDQRQDWVGQLLEAEGCFEPLSHDPRWREVQTEVERATWLPLGSRPADSRRAAKGKLPQRGPFTSDRGW